MKENLLVTGGAGFIGSHIVERCLSDDCFNKIFIIDDLSNGSLQNLSEVINDPRVEFVEASIGDKDVIKQLTKECDVISHQAALGSVPKSLNDPQLFFDVNAAHTFNLFDNARLNNIRRLVYASSSSVYGNLDSDVKTEAISGLPLSPYALTKQINEQYGYMFANNYGLKSIGLRYFNVFGPRQKKDGAYAAVIPQFIDRFLRGQDIVINGSLEITRDFTPVSLVAEVNCVLLKSNADVENYYNVALGESLSLGRLISIISEVIPNKENNILIGEYRSGDILHSCADTSKLSRLIDITRYNVHDLIQELVNVMMKEV